MERECAPLAALNDERTATNPLSDEQFIAREVVNELIDSTCFDVLRALGGSASTPTGIENQGLVSRQTASEHIAAFARHGLINQTVSSSLEYTLTYGGVFVLEAVETCLEDVTREQLSFLTRSPRPLQLLRTLRTRPATRNELSTAGDDSPSSVTIWRALQAFVDYGWCESKSGTYHLTSTGERTLAAYEELLVMAEQAVEKAPFLQRLSTTWSDFPTHALPDAEIVASEPASPGLVVESALKLCDPKTRHFRILTSVFNPTLFAGYHKLLKLGVVLEPVVDASVYEEICDNDDFHYLLNNSEYERYTLSRLEDSLTLGIGLYDDRKIAIGAYNEVGEGNHIAVLISSHEDLIAWGEDVYQTYREQALPPADSDY